MADNTEQLFGDYSPTIDSEYTTNPLQGLRMVWPQLSYAAGCKDNACTHYNADDVKTAATGSDLLFVCLGTGKFVGPNI